MEEKRKTREVDVIGLLQKVFAEKKLLVKFCGVAMVVGVVVALSTPKTYTAEVVLAPEMSSGGLGMAESLSDMASTFGIDLGSKSSMDAIYPEIYPDLLSSTDFILTLFDVKVELLEDTTLRTYSKHLEKDTKFGFWNYPKVWLGRLIKMLTAKPGKGGELNPFQLSKDEEKMVEAIRGAISCFIDKKTSVITLGVTDQDSKVAAIVADTLQHRLQAYITRYRTQKARLDLEYYEKLYDESLEQYHEAQQKYVEFADAHQDIYLTSYKMQETELENDMQLKFNVFNQMASQLQASRAKVQERTPAFTIIQQATVPNMASSTPRALIVFFFIFLGGVCDALWILYGRDYWKHRRERKSASARQGVE